MLFLIIFHVLLYLKSVLKAAHSYFITILSSVK